MRIMQFGFESLAVQTQRDTQRASELRTAQTAVQRTRVQRSHRQTQCQFIRMQAATTLQTPATRQTGIEIRQMQPVFLESEVGLQRCHGQALPIDGSRTSIDHRQSPAQTRRGLAQGLQFGTQIERGLRRTVDPGCRVDGRKLDHRTKNRLWRKRSDPRGDFASEVFTRLSHACTRTALQDKVLKPPLGSQIESERSPGSIAFDAGFGGQCEGWLGGQRRFSNDLQAANTRLQMRQSVQQAIARQWRLDRFGNRHRLPVRMGVLANFDAPDTQLPDFDRQRPCQVVGQPRGFAAAGMGYPQARHLERAHRQAAAQQLDRVPIDLQVLYLEIQRLIPPAQRLQGKRPAQRACRLGQRELASSQPFDHPADGAHPPRAAEQPDGPGQQRQQDRQHGQPPAPGAAWRRFLRRGGRCGSHSVAYRSKVVQKGIASEKSSRSLPSRWP
ncbi:MAG: hypothetical protein CAPSK01_000723 [Candidatus Accumulibacter vicinus]|uniref:Uncharacterized protein n=1 Tax=Candidatus Accumulibacter vicinus TaxID=2954382 RepID=A0A084Y4M0_9PROT|nr:MAG: hypothetical protein CAPSK01_000723 [Candidatus Accumulibacter vicinus]